MNKKGELSRKISFKIQPYTKEDLLKGGSIATNTVAVANNILKLKKEKYEKELEKYLNDIKQIDKEIEKKQKLIKEGKSILSRLKKLLSKKKRSNSEKRLEHAVQDLNSLKTKKKENYEKIEELKNAFELDIVLVKQAIAEQSQISGSELEIE